MMLKKIVQRYRPAAFHEEEEQSQQYEQGQQQLTAGGKNAIAAVDKQYGAQQDGDLQGGHQSGKQAYDDHKSAKKVEPGDDVRQPGKRLGKMAGSQQLLQGGGIADKTDAFGKKANAQRYPYYDQPAGMMGGAPLVNTMEYVHKTCI